MPRFVILLHETPPGAERGTHYDLMLEADGVLRTWAIAAPPRFDTPQPALPLADHRLAYLEYEGPLSGDRGQVTRWDQGEYRIAEENRTHLLIELAGTKLNGALGFDRSPTSDAWELWYLPLPDAET
jgi:hypothetical protein